MKLIKRWQKYILLLAIMVCVTGGILTVHAENSDYTKYAYKITQFVFNDKNLYDEVGSNSLSEISSYEIQNYDANEVRVDESKANNIKIYVGKMKFTVSTDAKQQQFYFPMESDVEYSIESPSANSGSGQKSDIFNEAVPEGANAVLVGEWRDNNIKYSTYYDLEITNTSDADLLLKNGNLSYIPGFVTSFDADKSQINYKRDTYTNTVGNLTVMFYPAFRRNIALENPEGNVKVSSNTVALSALDFRNGDKKVQVMDDAGNVRKTYTLHIDMPWKVTTRISGTNYNIVEIKYKDVNGTTVTKNASSGFSNIEVPEGNRVDVLIEPAALKDKQKILSTFQFDSSNAINPQTTVQEGTNRFSFIMPNGVVDFPFNAGFEESNKPFYSFNLESSKTNNDTLAMGTVTVKNSDGTTITSAQENTVVTATATPTEHAAYEFEFTGWTVEGLNGLSEEQLKNPEITFSMPANEVKLTANYQKKGVNVTIESSDYKAGQVAILYPYGYSLTTYAVTKNGSYTDTIKAGARISFAITDVTFGYTCNQWEVKQGSDTVTIDDNDYREMANGNCKYKAPYVTVTEGDDITVKAVFSQRKTYEVQVISSDSSMGTVEIEGGQSTQAIYKDEPVKLIAKPVSDIYGFVRWEVIDPSGAETEDSVELKDITTKTDKEQNKTVAQFTMIGQPVKIQAVFEKVKKSKDTVLEGLSLTDTAGKNIGRNSSKGNDYTVTLPDNLTKAEAEALVANTFKLKFTLSDFATATFNNGTSYTKEEWAAGQKVSGFTLNQPMTIHVTAENKTDTQDYTLTIAWNAKTDKELTAVTLQDSQQNDLGTGVPSGTDWTVTLSQDLTQTEVDNLFKAGFYLKLTISERARATFEGTGVGETWEAWAAGRPVKVLELNKAKKLTVTAEDGSPKDYTIKVAWSPKPTSKEKNLTSVELLDKDNKQVIAKGTLEGTAWTVKIPEDKYTKQQASNLAVGGSYLKLVASAGAKIEQKDGYTDNGADLEPWSSGNITTNMTLNKPYTFTVIAENGSRKEYTIMLSYPTEKPVLKAGTVTRSSDQEAKAVFSSTMAGKYYWAVVEQGEKEPNISTSYAGSTAKKGNNTVTLTSLEAGAKDLYIVVKSTDGEISDPLKMEIPAYDAAAKEYAIALNYPTSGGTLKASAAKAKAGDKITVTVTPKTGYKLTPGTLRYSEASSTGAVVNIDETTGTFIMPASEISISCTWTAESTDQPGTTTGKIGAFVVNGVSGTVDNTTGTITVTLPNGTDLTSLAPVITISGAKSISPASGATVDLSSPVTYTLTLEDGTTKTYTVRAYVEAPSKSDQLWNDMLNNVDGSPDHSGSKTWWKKAKDLKKHNDYPEYW